MLQRGQIYYLKNFKQGENNRPKNRYCIILSAGIKESAIIFHKVTSQSFCIVSTLKEGKNTVNSDLDVFFFPKNIVIGKAGFFFEIDSFVNMGVWNISEWAPEKFNSFDPNYIDDMLDSLFNELVYFVYKSDHIKQKYIPILEEVLLELNPIKE